MGTESTLYRIVLILHILVAIVGIGTVFLNGVYGAESKKRPGPGGLAISQASYRVSMIAENFIYAIFVLGVVLVLLSDGQWTFSQTWVWLSIVVFVISLGVSHGVLLPRVRRMNALGEEMAAAGPPPAGAHLGHTPGRIRRSDRERVAHSPVHRSEGTVPLRGPRRPRRARRGWPGPESGHGVPGPSCAPYFSTPSCLLIIHCWAIDKMLLVSQYSTSPEGKKKNITLNASGMIHISLACIGSGGVGFNQVCNKVDKVISTGKMKYGSGDAKSWTQAIQGASRISTVDKSTQYSAMKTGI